MCTSCDWETFVDSCEDALTDIEQVSDRCDAKESWEEKVTGMQEWARDNEHVTERMTDALDRIVSGVSRWLR